MKGATICSAGRDWPESISIHAPVKGATCDCETSCRECKEISIHAPVKGATGDELVLEEVLVISIHAPVKGATSGSSSPRRKTMDFNPRTREGCDEQEEQTGAGGK